MKNLLTSLLRPFSLEVNPKGTAWEKKVFQELYREIILGSHRKSAVPVESVIFSKDRPLQLHALLSSYIENISEPVPSFVLYHTSNDTYLKAYNSLANTFADQPITFIKQQNKNSFKEDLVQILQNIRSDKIFFLVDDIIFVEHLDVSDFVNFNLHKYIPSLRLGKNITTFYHFDTPQELPCFHEKQDAGKSKLYWCWENETFDWAYPLSLDGNLFLTDEISSVINKIAFKAPNTLEDGLQDFVSLFNNRTGVCYPKSIILNIPCNKVQSENNNKFGEVSQEYLLEKWQEGFQMDYKKLFGFVNKSPQQDITFRLIPQKS